MTATSRLMKVAWIRNQDVPAGRRAMSDDQNNPNAMHELKTSDPTESVVRSMPWFGGIRILESSHCQERVWWRRPRSKKRRTRLKWELREENVRYEPRAYKMGADTVMCHPSIAKRLREEMPPNNQLKGV